MLDSTFPPKKDLHTARIANAVRLPSVHEALKLYHEKRALKRKGGLPAPTILRRGQLTFKEIANDALAYADEHKRSAQHDHWRMKKLIEWFGSKRADSIRAKEIEERFKEQNWAPATWNRHRALMSLTFRLAIRAEKLTEKSCSARPARDRAQRTSSVFVA